MCEGAAKPGPGGEPGELSMGEALGMLDRALDALAAADAASLPTQVQADALRALERAGSRRVAARSRVLAAFMARDGCVADGQGTAKAWLRWQTKVTRSAAAGAVGWARRLNAHPAIAAALADGNLSVSWAKAMCEWTDRLPGHARAGADDILMQAAAEGADLTDLAGLAEEMLRRAAGPDTDDDDGFDDRYLHLGQTWRGAGRVEGDLTPGCAAALTAVIEALARKAGPEDTRTAAQRRHDALEEAARRLIAAGMVPGRAGQPTQIQVHLTLSQLRDLPGAADTEAEWAAARATEPGWLTGPDADAAACDATIIPVVTGRPDPAALDRLTEQFLADTPSPSPSPSGSNRNGGGGASTAGCPGPGPQPLSGTSQRRLRRALLGLAADALSGPGGLAAWLRTGLPYAELATPSLPLEAGASADTIPAHLRRAVLARHRHCAFAGCQQPASVCHVHHLIPRSEGGPTSLPNLAALCSFHHLVAVHRWGWHLVLNPDGTTAATSPDGTRTLHSHSPPAHAA